MMWSKVKNSIRSQEPRDDAQLIKAIGNALDSVTASDAIGWFGHGGYNII